MDPYNYIILVSLLKGESVSPNDLKKKQGLQFLGNEIIKSYVETVKSSKIFLGEIE